MRLTVRNLGLGMLWLLACGATSASAATSIWINGTSGLWTNGANWIGGSAPGVGDTASVTSKLSNAAGVVQTNVIAVDGQYAVNTLLMDWTGLLYSNAATVVCLTGATANASLSMTNLYLSWGDGKGGNYIAISNTLAFSNMSLAVGSSSARGVMQLGQKVSTSSNFCMSGTVMALGTNATFTGYLSQLLLGFGGSSSGSGLGILDLSQARSMTLDVSGNVEVGGSSSGGANYQTGNLLLNNGSASAGNLYVAYTTAAETQTGTTPAKNGSLTLSNATFQIPTNGVVYLGGRGQNANAAYQRNIAAITVAADGTGGGLDIRNASTNGLFFKYPTLLNADGANYYKYNQITITLGSPNVSSNGWIWGLRWAGNHVSTNTQAFSGTTQGLVTLLDATNQYARLRVVTNALTDSARAQHLTYLKTLDPARYGSKTIADLTCADFIVYDAGSTYVGVYAVPLPFMNNVGGVSNLTLTSADVSGTLVSTGASPTTVLLYWGTADGSNTASAWANTNVFADYPVVGPVTTNLTGLSSNTVYFYRYCATNAFGAGWASSSTSFKTLGAPEVNNAGGATAINATRATLNGTLINGTSAHLYFYLWASGAPVTNVYDCGTLTEGAFSTNLTGLTAGTTYYYQACATNTYGQFLAAVTNFVTPAAAAWYVTTNGSSGGNGTSWAQAFTNIQTAIDTAASGDTIYLAAQTFTPLTASTGLGKVQWMNKTLSILGGYAADGGSPGALTNALTTVYNASTYNANSNRVLYVVGVTNGVLARVKVLGGKAGFANAQQAGQGGTNYYGGGMYAANCTNLTVDGVVFDGNGVAGMQGCLAQGGGLYATNSWGLVTNCVFKNGWMNRFYGLSVAGVGFCAQGGGWLVCDSVIRDNATANNTAAGDGVGYGIGLYFIQGIHTLRNCVVSRNYASSLGAAQGDALYLAAGTAAVENCTFYWHKYEGVRRAGGSLTVRNSIVWECGDDIAGTSVSLQYCDIQDGDSNGVANCFSGDPRFDRGLYLATNSPCVNAGSTNAVDAGLSTLTTRADGTGDTGAVDLGYHFAGGVTDLYVSVNSGSDTNTGTSAGAAFKSITKALSVVRNGAHINVAAGNYTTNTETFPLTLPSNSYGIQVLGTNATLTTISAAGVTNARVLGMSFNYPDARVEGVTLRGGYMQLPDSVTGLGGGLYAAHSRGIVDACVISNNWVKGAGVNWGGEYGGGLYMAQSWFIVSNLLVAGNTAQGAPYGGAAGAGLSWVSSDGLIDACTFVGNRALSGPNEMSGNNMGSLGGGVYLSSDGMGTTLRNSLIASNNALDGYYLGKGSGLYLASAASVLNCTIATNRATGVHGAVASVLTNCIAWGNGIVDATGLVTAVYSDIGGGYYTPGVGAISTNPAFVDAAGGNFRLALGSPCVNAGTNVTGIGTLFDLDGAPRVNNAFVDQGAYEQVTPVYIVNRNPTNVTASTAWMNGALLSTGGSPTHVWLFWGPSDGSTNKDQWANTNDFGVRSVGDLTTNITFGGYPTYFYRYYASNDVSSESWASPAVSFDVAGGITVVATDPAAAELGQDAGVFTISRPASATGLPANINFALAGAAVNGLDYQSVATNVTIPAGMSNVAVTITPIIDRIVEGPEDVILTITAGSYLIDSPSTATVTIADWAAPTTFYAGSGGNSTYATNWATAFSNLQQAIDAAQNGDVIRLAGQTFTLPGATNGLAQLVWTNKGLSLLGGYDTNGLAGELAGIPTTIYNVGGAVGTTNRVLYLSGVTNGTLLRLKVSGGRIGNTAADFYGAGLYMQNCTNMTLDSVTFEGNSIAGYQSRLSYGAGLYAVNSWGTITNGLFRNNYLTRYYGGGVAGGGLYLQGGSWLVRDSVIRDNTTYNNTVGGDSSGSGIGICLNQGVHTLRNCAVTRNYGLSATTPQGEGLYLAAGTATVENCTFYWHRFEGVRRAGGLLTLRNSIVWECGDDVAGGMTLQNCDIQDGDSNGVANCMASDPGFERGLYLAATSLCVNAGSTNAVDAGVAGRTTRADGTLDSDAVDLGYHFASGVTDLFVSVDAGSDTNAGTNASAPFKTLRKACSVVGDGGHIYVAAGNYTTNTETFPASMGNVYGVQVLGADPTQTVINLAGGNARAIGMSFNYPDAVVRNLTVVNANWSLPGGGWGSPGTLGFGMYLNHVRGVVNGCAVTNSVIPRYGGGNGGPGYPAGAFYAASSDLAISNCVATGNRAISGYAEGCFASGMVLADVNADLANCIVGSNVATGATEPGYGFSYGGGLYLNGAGTVRNCLIYGNSATGIRDVHGQGVYATGTWRFEHCTVVTNALEGVYKAGGTVSMTNCIAWGNGMDVTGSVWAAFCDIGTGNYTDGGNNQSVDPQFAGTSSNNFRLTRDSLCINAGTNLAWVAGAVDLDGNKRKSGAAVDMGAYEFPIVPPGAVFTFR